MWALQQLVEVSMMHCISTARSKVSHVGDRKRVDNLFHRAYIVNHGIEMQNSQPRKSDNENSLTQTADEAIEQRDLHGTATLSREA